MKKLLKNTLLVILCIGILMSFTSCNKSKDNEKTIAVVAKGESHAFWQSVKKGAEDAAEKHGYTITFRGPASESAKDLPAQQEMVQSALSNNVKGLVLATIGEGFTDMLAQAYDKKIPVVQFDSGIWENDIKALNDQNKNPVVASVATSNRMAAGLAAEHFFKELRDDIAESDGDFVIGVIQHDQTQTGQDRANGFIDEFTRLADADTSTAGKYRIEHEVKPGDADNAYKAALEALYEKDARAIFMSNEGVVKQVYDAVRSAGEKYDDIEFCGFDAGSKQIEWMKSDDGAELIGAVAQNSYEIGYNAVEQVIFAIEDKEITENVEISGAWWDKDNADNMIKDNLVYQG